MFVKIKKTALTLLVLTLSLCLVFTILIAAVFLLPDKTIDQNAHESAVTQENEDSEINVWSKYSTSFEHTNITDVIMVMLANGDSIFDYNDYLHNEISLNGFSGWVDVSNNRDFSEGKGKSLLSKAMFPSYARYWHGYTIFLRPLLMFGSLGFIRNFNYVVMFLSFAILVFLMAKRFHIGVTVIFALAFTAVQGFLVPISMACFVTFFLSVIFSIIMLKEYERIKEKQWEIFFFFIAGALTTYFDFLVTPMLTLLIPLTFYFLMELQSKEASPKNSLIIMSKSVMGWGLGYVLLWLSKWTLASMVFKQSVFGNALASTSERFGTSSSFIQDFQHLKMGTLRMRLIAISESMNRLIDNGYVRLLIYFAVFAVLTALAVWNVRRRKVTRDFFLNLLPLAAIAVAPFAWYFILSNHSYFHPITYRNLAATVFALGAIFLCLFKADHAPVAEPAATLPEKAVPAKSQTAKKKKNNKSKKKKKK